MKGEGERGKEEVVREMRKEEGIRKGRGEMEGKRGKRTEGRGSEGHSDLQKSFF